MENDNEAFADVLKEFLDLANGTYEEDGWKYNYHIDNYEAIRKLNRIEAAHKRALAAKDEQYIKCREELDATRNRRDECEVKMFKAFERVTEAGQKLVAKDREIAKLIANLDAIEKAMERVCSRDMIAEIQTVKKEIQDGEQ